MAEMGGCKAASRMASVLAWEGLVMSEERLNGRGDVAKRGRESFSDTELGQESTPAPPAGPSAAGRAGGGPIPDRAAWPCVRPTPRPQTGPLGPPTDAMPPARPLSPA